MDDITRRTKEVIEDLIRYHRMLAFVTDDEDIDYRLLYSLENLEVTPDLVEMLQHLLSDRDVTVKQCTAECRLWKPAYQFCEDKQSKDGRSNRCKACERRRVKEHSERKDETKK